MQCTPNRTQSFRRLEGDSTIPTRATANKEVLLCAGAIASPQILQRSGVGNAELLAEFDIPLAAHRKLSRHGP